jgi:integrase
VCRYAPTARAADILRQFTLTSSRRSPAFGCRQPDTYRQEPAATANGFLTVAAGFLESARSDGDGLYAAYVLLLVLGLRKGELLGLTWEMVSLGDAELYVGE